MAAKDNLHRDQFKFAYEFDPLESLHTLQATHEPTQQAAGFMSWGTSWEDEDGGEGVLNSIDVYPKFRRKGVATAMWNHAKDLAKTDKNISYPIHSTFRTHEGDVWANSTGDFVPHNDMPEKLRHLPSIFE